MSTFAKGNPFSLFSGTPFFGTPCFLFFCFFLALQRLAAGRGQMLDGRVLGASQVEYKPFGKPPLKRKNTANAGNFTTVGDVSTGTLTASGAATRSHRNTHGRRADHHGAASAGPLGCGAWTAPSRPRAAECRRAAWCADVTSSGTVSAPQLFASNTLTVTNTSDFSDDLFLTKNWAVSSWSGTAGRTSASHHDQRRGAGADEEPLHAAVPDHEPEEPRLPRDREQHGQRGLQHELHKFVGKIMTPRMLAIWLQVAFQASQPLQGFEKTKKKRGPKKIGSRKKGKGVSFEG